MERKWPDERGFFGSWGGKFVPETVQCALLELETAYRQAKEDPAFQNELQLELRNYVGRETPLYFAANLTRLLGGARIYLKREDLNHTGAHKARPCWLKEWARKNCWPRLEPASTE